MKKLMLMAGVAMVALPHPSREQIPVTDGGLIGLETSSWFRQAADMAHQLDQMKQSFRVATGTLGSLLRTIDPNNIAREVGSLNPLGDVGQITGSITGLQGMVSVRGINMQSLTSALMRGNNYYTSPYENAGTFNTNLWDRGGASLASLQAMATQNLSSAQNHISAIDEIQAQLSAVTSEADLSAVRGRLDAETAALTANNLQVQSLTTMWQAQREALEFQKLQRQRENSDKLFESAGGGNGPSPGTGNGVMAGSGPPPAMPASFSTIPPGG